MIVPETDPVPPRFRGVWRRSLLRTPQGDDTTTTVYWLQTSRWHADIRVPADRPEFDGVNSLDECSLSQLQWLATQQGFAGVTRVDPGNDDTAWLRVVDFQPPATLPDEGHAAFRDGMLVETGIHADYLEHWHPVPGSGQGFAVFRQRDTARSAYLLLAGHCVMYVRPRTSDFDADGWRRDGMLRRQLDFEISFGERTPDGWIVRHSTLPWCEGREIAMALPESGSASIELVIDGVATHWDVLERTAL